MSTPSHLCVSHCSCCTSWSSCCASWSVLVQSRSIITFPWQPAGIESRPRRGEQHALMAFETEQAGWVKTSVNMMNLALGSGLLAIPSVIQTGQSLHSNRLSASIYCSPSLMLSFCSISLPKPSSPVLVLTSCCSCCPCFLLMCACCLQVATSGR